METKIQFSEFIKDFKTTLHELFHEENDINQLSLERGLPADVLNKIMSKKPLSVAIPLEYGGRGGHVKECLEILSAASYESLSLSLTFGINIALFLEPVAKYAEESVKPDIFNRFLKNQNMGGLMITEPDYGSDALNMKTFSQENDHGYSIKGSKHWQGLTGMADYWLIAARNKTNNGDLSRDVDFYIADNSKPKQHVIVEEIYDNPGLYMIPYGLNTLDLEIPKNQRLIPETTGIKMMLDILHRSRLQFPGMATGFIKRMLDEATQHCKNRIVGAGNLLALDQVQFQLARIQSAFTISSAMCLRSTKISGVEHNVATNGLEANSMKTVVTDLMHESAQILTQVSGANGYRVSHIGGRGIMDSRPFQIFEGSNEMLYSQISDMITRSMKKKKMSNLLEFLKSLDLTAEACEYFKKDLNFNIASNFPQRKLVDLGRIIARIVSVGYVLELQDKGFRKDLIDNCITMVQQEISGLFSVFHFDNSVKVIEDYSSNSSWSEFV
ncbi:acyl-CoA dehydrogenase family protein [Gelidibacter salicanalis]|uniref:Acyl-CoA/acyl-ACP dehydrogenase n=1 Tax=Gelidibacter salicanalis TaxID=291193 RepID=A0A934KSD0_9FLAO|nr:acyl-CoA dehydrogenase family protein [Gelidibacter salicanalis]MBJ7879218.1 acyl-CoA/acyl-ACP dehydrogenase [Gelidibacter salicanalis]